MSKTHDHLEIEVKFFIADAGQIQRRLEALGVTAGPEVFETNVRYENSDHSFKAQDQLLRLRRDESCRLTFKSRPQKDDRECKVLNELEVQVDDCDTMDRLLQALGYHPVQIYEKTRRTYIGFEVEFCLDVMPFGTFLEIEGSKPRIKEAARRLGLAWEDRILANYLEIFEGLRAKYKLPFKDVTFTDFEKHPVDVVPLLPMLRAGANVD